MHMFHENMNDINTHKMCLRVTDLVKSAGLLTNTNIKIQVYSLCRQAEKCIIPYPLSWLEKWWNMWTIRVFTPPSVPPPAPTLSPPTCPFLLSGRGAHGDRQGALWQVWAGAVASHTVHPGEEVPTHLLAGMAQHKKGLHYALKFYTWWVKDNWPLSHRWIPTAVEWLHHEMFHHICCALMERICLNLEVKNMTESVTEWTAVLNRHHVKWSSSDLSFM